MVPYRREKCSLKDPERPVITVITITRRRPLLLRRAIRSVVAQRCDASIEHLVLVDDCLETAESLSSAPQPPNLSWRLMSRSASDSSGPGRSAVIRNWGVEIARGEWISFLDDDNEFEAEHLQSLLATASHSGLEAVHSWMRVFTKDGAPFIEQLDPWTSDVDRSHRRYQWMISKGVRSSGSNVFRDRVDPPEVSDPVQSVDTGEWLLHRSLLLTIPVPTEFSQSDWENMITEDDKLLHALLRAEIAIACTRKATLRYYLGGYSNSRALL